MCNLTLARPGQARQKYAIPWVRVHRRKGELITISISISNQHTPIPAMPEPATYIHIKYNVKYLVKFKLDDINANRSNKKNLFAFCGSQQKSEKNGISLFHSAIRVLIREDLNWKTGRFGCLDHPSHLK